MGLVVRECRNCGRKAPIPAGEDLCFSCTVDEIVTKGKEDDVGKKGVCKKCGREVSLHAKGLCFKCYKEEWKAEAHLRVTLDFTPYPDLLEALQEKAREEFRDLSHQILWCIHQYVKGTPREELS